MSKIKNFRIGQIRVKKMRETGAKKTSTLIKRDNSNKKDKLNNSNSIRHSDKKHHHAHESKKFHDVPLNIAHHPFIYLYKYIKDSNASVYKKMN